MTVPMPPIRSLLSISPVLPVIVLHDAADAVALADALLEGGIGTMEVTLRTPAALAAIESIRRHVPAMVVGAGSVRAIEQVPLLRDAGACSGVSPGLSVPLVQAAQARQLPFLPGIATASEAMAAIEAGCSDLKLFPAGSLGGTAYVAALSAPLPQAHWYPSGGIDAVQAAQYLALASVVAVGGSWMAPERLIAARDWRAIRSLARACGALRA
jgi:2-dehydro-3-deoxyphosphogluconate aldolase/(4S)-4-hydroxy-2-oxoglutarate aldolase